HVANADGHVIQQVAARMDEWCVWGERRARVEDGGNLVVLHVDEVQSFARRVRVDGRERGNWFSGVANPVDRYHRHIPEVRPEVGARATGSEVIPGQHGDHARVALGAAGTDLDDPRVWKRAAQDGANEHAGDSVVQDIRGAASDAIRGVDHRHATSDGG